MSKKTTKQENQKIIDVKNLNVSFPSAANRKRIINIIRGVDISVYQGQIIGFIGESGSGKSVTARSLFGMNTNAITTANRLTIKDLDMLDPKDESETRHVLKKNDDWSPVRGNKITYIPQNPMTSLNPTMKIKNQLLEVINHTGKYENLTKEEKIGMIVDLLDSFGIQDVRTRINMYPHEFSGGMKQRIVIAMAILSGPDVIIADEPTTALDPTVQASILELLTRIVRKNKIALIFVTHDISLIATLADYIYIFYAGRVIEKGNKYEVLTNSQHPYTWALFSAMPETAIPGKELNTLDGTPPNFANLPSGDPFSVRNKYAMEVDFKVEPKLFKVQRTESHYAATWLLHPDAPKMEKPKQVIELEKSVKGGMKERKK